MKKIIITLMVAAVLSGCVTDAKWAAEHLTKKGWKQWSYQRAGLELAVQLKEMLDGMVAVLSAEQATGALPDKITLAATDEVDNPFG